MKTIKYSFEDYFFAILNTIFFINITDSGFKSRLNFLNTSSWSVSAEILLYIIFGFVSYVKKNFLIVNALLLLITLGFILTDWNILVARAIFSFSLGIFINPIFNRKSQNTVVNQNFYSLLYLLLFLVLYYKSDYLISYNLRYIIIPVASSIFLMNRFRINLNIKIFNEFKKILSYVGVLSFSIYLNHSIIIVITAKILNHFNFTFEQTWKQILIIAISTFFLFCYSKFTYKVIENFKIFK